MIKYVGKTCPYCKSVFTENDEIVVCSDCDMPHHKDCWIENKGCTTFGCQGTIQGIDFGTDVSISSAPKYDVRDADSTTIAEAPAFCSRCGSPVVPGNPFCSKCGAPIASTISVGDGSSGSINKVASKVSSEFRSVMGNFKTEDSIDQEMGEYIGSKKEYYLQVFGELKSQKKYTSWNTFAFLISPFWFMYRKMYIPGGVLLGIDLILALIGGILSGIIGVVIALGAGFLANYFYMYDIEQRVKKGKELTGPQKTVYIEQKGDVNATVPSIAAVVYALICAIVLTR